MRHGIDIKLRPCFRQREILLSDFCFLILCEEATD